MKDRRYKPEDEVKIAKERINILFNQAAQEFKSDPKLSDRYVFLARKIGMRYNVHFTSEQKRQFCKKCNHFLVPGANCRVRTNPKTKCVEYLCTDCNHVNRFGYSKEQTE